MAKIKTGGGGRPLGAPQPGDTAPGFELRTAPGVEVTLAACLLEGPLLVEFIRGTWDPDARRRLAELSAALDRFREWKARVVVIACERPWSVARYLEERPGPLTLLIDGERKAARAYGVLKRFSLPPWNLARPASFLVDRCGFVRFAYVAPMAIRCADLGEILGALRGLGDEPRVPRGAGP